MAHRHRAVPGPPLATRPTAVIRLDTSGYDAASGTITGIAAVRFPALDAGGLEAFERQLFDGALVSAEMPSVQQQASAFADVWTDLARFLTGSIVLSHGAASTATWLRKATLMIGVEWHPTGFLCTRRLARAVFPDLDRYGLDHLVEALALSSVAAGSADARCLAVAEIYRLCLARLADLGITDLGQVRAYLDAEGPLIEHIST